MFQRFVNLRHREQLGGRSHFAASGELPQRAQFGWVTDRRAGDAAVVADKGKGRYRERLHHRVDGVEVAALGQGFEVRLPVKIHRHGVDAQVKLPGQHF
ncbi:hypothetical protein HMPREF9348_05608 [Escherichia coli MS 145-7]|nr:hypothetical protein HMPREF9348_05608 [Escherichia coli MS 145-7]